MFSDKAINLIEFIEKIGKKVHLTTKLGHVFFKKNKGNGIKKIF